MENDKKWYASKTVWGGLVALAGAVCGMLGVSIDQGVQQQMVGSFADAGAAIGALVAIWGRITATTTLTR